MARFGSDQSGFTVSQPQYQSTVLAQNNAVVANSSSAFKALKSLVLPSITDPNAIMEIFVRIQAIGSNGSKTWVFRYGGVSMFSKTLTAAQGTTWMMLHFLIFNRNSTGSQYLIFEGWGNQNTIFYDAANTAALDSTKAQLITILASTTSPSDTIEATTFVVLLRQLNGALKESTDSKFFSPIFPPETVYIAPPVVLSGPVLATEQTIASWMVPANTLGPNGMLYARLTVAFKPGDNNKAEIRVYLGSTSLLGLVNLGTGVNSNQQEATCEFFLFNQNDPASQGIPVPGGQLVFYAINGLSVSPSAFAVQEPAFLGGEGQSPSMPVGNGIDTTSSQLLKFTVKPLSPNPPTPHDFFIMRNFTAMVIRGKGF